MNEKFAMNDNSIFSAYSSILVYAHRFPVVISLKYFVMSQNPMIFWTNVWPQKATSNFTMTNWSHYFSNV